MPILARLYRQLFSVGIILVILLAAGLRLYRIAQESIRLVEFLTYQAITLSRFGGSPLLVQHFASDRTVDDARIDKV